MASLASLATQSLECWDIEEAGIELLKYRENAVFAITDLATKQRYAMRVHRAGYHSDEQLRSELQWMTALDRAGISTPPVIPARTGALFVVTTQGSVPEPRQVDLLGWIEGKPIGTIENDLEFDPQEVGRNHFLAGQLAARIHNHSEKWKLPDGFTRRSWDAEGLIGDKGHFGCFRKLDMLSMEQRNLLLEARELIQERLTAFGKSPDRYGLTHADFLPENLLADGDELRIIDFDDCGFGWNMMDIATSLFFLIGEPSYDAAYEGLIAGYRSERALPHGRLEMLPTFLLTRGLNYLAWIQSRQETETAQEIGPILVEGVTALAHDYLGMKEHS